MDIMANKLDRRVERTKRDLKDAFLKLAKSDNTHEITIKEIMHQANYNRATFYAHYQDKESLIEELISDILNGLIQSIQSSYKNIKVLNLQQLSISTVMIFEYIYQKKETFLLLLDAKKFPNFNEQFCQTIVKLLKYDSQYVSPAFEQLNREIWEYTEAYALFGMLQYWAKGNFELSKEYMTIQLIERLKFRPDRVKYSANIIDFK